MNAVAPPFDESKIAAVRLLQGPVYFDDVKTWDLVLSNETKLREFFSGLGMMLVISENDGFAFIRQFEEEEFPEGYEQIPTLMRKSRLGFDATLLAVLLREELRKFDENDLDSESCVVKETELFESFADFFGKRSDEKKIRTKFSVARAVMLELKFIKILDTEPVEILIRPIVKARLTPERLRETKEKLEAHLESDTAD